MTNQYAQEEWAFILDLIEENEEEYPTERGREFQMTGPMH